MPIVSGGDELFWAFDIDNDGDLDTIQAGGHTDWWENLNGDGMSWDQHVLSGSTTNGCATLGEFDSDGDPDVVSAYNDGIWWHEMRLPKHRDDININLSKIRLFPV